MGSLASLGMTSLLRYRAVRDDKALKGWEGDDNLGRESVMLYSLDLWTPRNSIRARR
jgi:hypothetical protein